MSTPVNGPGPEGQPENHRPQDGGQQGYQQQGGQPYGQQGYYQEPPKKKRKKWPWIVGAIVLLLILLFAGCAALIGGAAKSVNDSIQSSAPSESAEGGSSDGAASGKDQLQVDATASESATASYGAGGSMSTAEMGTTWTETVTAKTTDFFTVTVQDKSGASDAKVTCTLTRDGKTVQEQSATGAYSIATCTDTP